MPAVAADRRAPSHIGCASWLADWPSAARQTPLCPQCPPAPALSGRGEVRESRSSPHLLSEPGGRRQCIRAFSSRVAFVERVLLALAGRTPFPERYADRLPFALRFFPRDVC